MKTGVTLPYAEELPEGEVGGGGQRWGGSVPGGVLPGASRGSLALLTPDLRL